MSLTASASAVTAGAAQSSGGGRGVRRASPWIDVLFSAFAHGAAWLTLALLAAILVSLVFGAAPAIREYGLAFLWTSEWDPVQNRYGGLVMIYGTLMTSAIALVIAVPVSFGIALSDRAFAALAEAPARYRHRAARRSAVDRLRHVGPPRVQPHPFAIRPPAAAGGVQGRAAAGRALLRTAGGHRPALGRNHPRHHGDPLHRLGHARCLRGHAADAQGIGYALGSTTWEVVSKVVLPYTKTGVVGGIMLGLGRALGETMAVTFVIGNFNQLSSL